MELYEKMMIEADQMEAEAASMVVEHSDDPYEMYVNNEPRAALYWRAKNHRMKAEWRRSQQLKS